MNDSLVQLRSWLVQARFELVPDYAVHHKRSLSFLTALTYDQDELISWRAVTAVGLAAACIADKDPEYVRGHLRRLVWLLNDESGGIGWRAPEAMGEIIHHSPALFAEFIPILISCFQMEVEQDASRFRPGVLWGLRRVAQAAPELVEDARPAVAACLDDLDPLARGLAAWCLAAFPPVKALPASLLALLADPTLIPIYDAGQINQRTVSDLAQEAITAAQSV